MRTYKEFLWLSSSDPRCVLFSLPSLLLPWRRAIRAMCLLLRLPSWPGFGRTSECTNKPVEWIISTHHQQSIDRENRLVMTWDRNLKKYRVWRFETLDPLPPESTEGEIRFSDDEMIMEWKGPNAAVRGIDVKFYRNRVRLTGEAPPVVFPCVLCVLCGSQCGSCATRSPLQSCR